MKNNRTTGIVNTIEQYLSSKNIDFVNLEHQEDIDARKNGKTYSLEEHLRGLIYSLLSNQRRWVTVVPNLPALDELFFGYEIDRIVLHTPDYFIQGIYRLKCGNISTQKQMNTLHDNIRMFQSIEAGYQSLDRFYSGYQVYEVARLLSDPQSEFKLKSVGHALAWQYLRNVGFDGAKPDVHLRRILGAKRLGYGAHDTATEEEVLAAIESMSRDTGLSRSYINDLLWYFCSDGYGSMCNARPDCEHCPITICNYRTNNK